MERRKEDGAIMGEKGGALEVAQLRKARLRGVATDMKNMGLRLMEHTADVVKTIAQPLKRRFEVSYEELTQEGWSRPKVMKFTNILDDDVEQEEQRISHGFSLADKINFRPFVLKKTRLIDDEEGIFLDEVMQWCERMKYHWNRLTHADGSFYTTAEMTEGNILADRREAAFRHTSLYQLTRCSTLIVSDSLLGSQGGNGYLRVTACQIVLTGVTSDFVRRFTDWLLLRYARKAMRVVMVAGTNDFNKMRRGHSATQSQLRAHAVVQNLCMQPLERNAIGYWLMPPTTTNISDWAQVRFLENLAHNARSRVNTLAVTPIFPPEDMVMRRVDGLHPLPWCIPWMLLMLEEDIQRREGKNRKILFDKAQAENLFALGSMVRLSIACTSLGNDDSHSLWCTVDSDELTVLGQDLIPREAPGLCVARPSDSITLTEPKILIQEAYDEYQGIIVQRDRDWSELPVLQVEKKPEIGFSILGDQLVALITDIYERRPLKYFNEDMQSPLAEIVKKGLRAVPGMKGRVDTSDVENWTKYDENWTMPQCMQLGSYKGKPEVSREAWRKYFFSLSMRDLGGLYAMMGAETFAAGPGAMREVVEGWTEDQWFTAKLLLNRKTLKLVLKNSSPHRIEKTDNHERVAGKPWGKAERRRLSIIKYIEENENRRISLAELACRLGVQPNYLQQTLGNHAQALWGFTGYLLPNIPKIWLKYARHIFHLGSYFKESKFETSEKLRRTTLKTYRGRPVIWKNGFQDVHSALLLTYENEEFIEQDETTGRKGMIYDLATQSLRSWATQEDGMGNECRDRLMAEIDAMGKEGLAIRELYNRAIMEADATERLTLGQYKTLKVRQCQDCIAESTRGELTPVQVSCDECRLELCVPCDHKRHRELTTEQRKEHRRMALPNVTLTPAQLKVLNSEGPRTRNLKPAEEFSPTELLTMEEEMNPNVVITLRAGSRMITAADVRSGAIPKRRQVVITPGRLPLQKRPATSDEVANFANTGPRGGAWSDYYARSTQAQYDAGELNIREWDGRKMRKVTLEPTTSSATITRPRESGTTPMMTITAPTETTAITPVVFETEPIQTTPHPNVIDRLRESGYLDGDQTDLSQFRLQGDARENRGILEAMNNQPGARTPDTTATGQKKAPENPFNVVWKIKPGEDLFVQRHIAIDPNAPAEEPFDPDWNSSNIMQGLRDNNAPRMTSATVDGRPASDPMSAFNEPHRAEKRRADGDDEETSTPRRKSKASGRDWLAYMPIVDEEDEGDELVAAGEGWTATMDFRERPSEAQENATTKICLRCRAPVERWEHPCRHSGGYAVMRGIPGKLQAAATMFNGTQDSLPKEFAKLGDMLTTDAWEAIVGEFDGVVPTGIDCEAWQGWFPLAVHNTFPNLALKENMTIGEVERTLHDFCVQAAAVERSGPEVRTAFNIHFRIPERAIPMIISPAAHKTLAALRERECRRTENRNRSVTTRIWSTP